MSNRKSFTGHFADLLLLLVLCSVIFFYNCGRAPFFDKQEAREALVVVAMLDSGNWILPLRNGNEIPSKPPLYHWLAAITSRAFGQTYPDEFTLRFPSALLAAAGVFLVYFVGAALWERRAGLASAILLATSIEWFDAAKVARVDMALTFILLCAFLYFFYLYRTGCNRAEAVILGALLGFATLAKGPLGVVVPGFAYLIFLWIRRDLAAIKRAHPLLIIGAWAVVATSWYGLAFLQSGRDFLNIVIKENFTMVIGKEAGHPHGFYWYLPIFFQKAAPWSLFLIPVALWLCRRRRSLVQEPSLYFAIWFTTVFVFFSIFTQKRSVYILSIYPAFALLFGAWLVSLKTADDAWSGRILNAIGAISAASFVLFSAVLFLHVVGPGLTEFIAPHLYPKDREQFAVLTNILLEHRWMALLWAGFCAGGGLVALYLLTKSRWEAVFWCIGGMMLISLISIQQFDSDLAQRYTFKGFMAEAQRLTHNEPLCFYASPDYSVIFYARERVPICRDMAAQGEIPRYVLFWENEWKQLADKNGLTILRKSDSIDRQTSSHGHLYLVAAERFESVYDGNSKLND